MNVKLPRYESECLFLVLRGYNVVGLSTTIVSNGLNCDGENRNLPVVIDSDRKHYKPFLSRTKKIQEGKSTKEYCIFGIKPKGLPFLSFDEACSEIRMC